MIADKQSIFEEEDIKPEDEPGNGRQDDRNTYDENSMSLHVKSGTAYQSYSFTASGEEETLNECDFNQLMIDYIVSNVDRDPSKNHYQQAQDTPLMPDGLSGGRNRQPDVYYENATTGVLAIGETKTNRDDLFAKNLGCSGLTHLQCQLIAYNAYMNSPDYANYNDKIIILAVPFELSSFAMKAVEDVSNKYNLNFIIDGNANNNGIRFKIITEITGKDIPVPSGFEEEDEAVLMKGVDNANNRMLAYDKRRVDIKKLHYDKDNTRFKSCVKTGHVLTDDDCYRLLITERTMAPKDSTQAIIRKNRFLVDGSITEELTGYIDDNGEIVVVDGNSRLANANYIVDNANSAPAYRKVIINVYDGNDRMALEWIKNNKQNPPVLQHGSYQIGLTIIDYIDNKHLSADYIRRNIMSQYRNVTLVEDIANTTRLLNNLNNVSDSLKERMYDCTYNISKSSFKFSNNLENRGISQQDVIKLIADNPDYIGNKDIIGKVTSESAGASEIELVAGVINDYKNGDDVMPAKEFKEKFESINEVSAKKLSGGLKSHGKAMMNILSTIETMSISDLQANGFNKKHKKDMDEIIKTLQQIGSLALTQAGKISGAID